MRNIISIVQGDDTNALGYNTIPCTVNTSLDLTGATVVFEFLDFKQEFTGVKSGEQFDIVIPHSSTSLFALGMQFASLYVIDAEGLRRTFNNRIPVNVTLCPIPDDERVEIEFNPIEQIMDGNDFNMYCSDWEFRQQFALLIKKFGSDVSNEELPE